MDLKSFKEQFPKSNRDNLFKLKLELKEKKIKEEDIKTLLKEGYSLPMIEKFLNQNGVNVKYSTLYNYSKELTKKK